jgi:predicted aconitase with swiveling domain
MKDNLIKLKGHTACKGIGEGEALVCRKPFMFLSYVDMQSGLVHAKDHELEGKNVKGKILVSPCGCGSTGEEPSLLLLKEAGVAPKALIIGSIVYLPGVIGAILAEIPMVYGFDRDALKLIETGDLVKVDANEGIIEVSKSEP